MSFPRITALGLALLAGLTLAIGAAWAEEQSVRPGINRYYQDPNFSEWLTRFERPGREIYDRRAAILAATGLRPGMTVADIGAGTGLFSLLFAPEVTPQGKVIAVAGYEQDGPNDESQPDATRKLVEVAMEEFGGVDAAYIRTAIHLAGNILDETPEGLDRSYDSNCKAVFIQNQIAHLSMHLFECNLGNIRIGFDLRVPKGDGGINVLKIGEIDIDDAVQQS